MLASRVSADAAFGGKISVQRLWAGDCEKSHGPEFALISHLLFWTGCDDSRVARLLLRCEGWKERREKWAERRAGKSHLIYTIDRERRSEERRVGQECVCTGRCRWSPNN